MGAREEGRGKGGDKKLKQRKESCRGTEEERLLSCIRVSYFYSDWSSAS